MLDVPAAAGHRVLLQLERLGTPLGPVLTVQPGGPGHQDGGSRLRFFVEAGTTASFLADLKELGWDPSDTDIRTIGVVLTSDTPLPAASSPRWARPPETEQAHNGQTNTGRAPTGQSQTGQTQPGRPVALPPARLLLGALAYACRDKEGRPVGARSRTARPPL